MEGSGHAHSRTSETGHGGLPGKAGGHGVHRRLQSAVPLLPQRIAGDPAGETPEIPEQEVLDFLASRRGLLDGVVLTGGEPLLQPDAADFLWKVRELGFAVKLDTNGCDPARLAEILNQGLVDYVAMDVKNAPARYAETVGIPGFNPAPVEESIRLLRKSTVDYEFRTTLVRELHRPEDLDAIAAWLAGAPRYYLQNFVDSGNLIGRGYHGFTAEQLQGFAERVRPFFGAVELRGID